MKKQTMSEIRQAAKDIAWMVENTVPEVAKASEVWQIENNRRFSKKELITIENAKRTLEKLFDQKVEITSEGQIGSI